jgi:hypothetical protein
MNHSSQSALASTTVYCDVANSFSLVSQGQETTNKLSIHWHYNMLTMRCITTGRIQKKYLDVSGSLNGALPRELPPRGAGYASRIANPPHLAANVCKQTHYPQHVISRHPSRPFLVCKFTKNQPFSTLDPLVAARRSLLQAPHSSPKRRCAALHEFDRLVPTS